MTNTYDPHDRRPIATREKKLVKRVASRLAATGLTANAISMLGMVCGIAAGTAFLLTGAAPEQARIFWIAGAALVQLRLAANMFDGMVALETGGASPLGELYNEVPDRVSDAATLIGLGYAAAAQPELGWAAALAAVLTAYVRAAVKVAGAKQDFCGPMAKPHRMFLVTVGALYCGLAPARWQPALDTGAGIPAAVLGVIILGSLWTTLRRLRHAARELAAP